MFQYEVFLVACDNLRLRVDFEERVWRQPVWLRIQDDVLLLPPLMTTFVVSLEI